MNVGPYDEDKLVGTFRRFGVTGPVYEILAVRAEGPSKVVDVEVPETGEKVTVKLEDVLTDPQAE
jgi:hypothetical protein